MPTYSSLNISNLDTEYSNKISRKPQLITKSELISLGKDIKLVGYDPLVYLSEKINKTFAPRLLNWVEPYEISGMIKTLFYTEVNSELKVGDRVFIINGNYDSDLLIKENKYRKGRDGYKILLVDNCKIVLDIDYIGLIPYNNNEIDDFIKIYHIEDKSEFIHANRQITTRNGNFEYKFDYYQNNIAFIENDYQSMIGWGSNGGVTGTPGFFVKNGTFSWTNVTSDIDSGTYSYALSPTYLNNDRIKIMNSDFTYNGKTYKEGFVYKWVVGPTFSEWQVDVTYFKPFISKNNFRDGNFKGTWNSGLFGRQDKQIKWEGDNSIWNTGSLLNTKWIKGEIKSLYTTQNSYFSSFDNYGLPYQKYNSPNNAGRGYNFIVDSEIDSSIINNGTVYKTSIGSLTSTYSIVENELLGYSTEYLNNIKQSFFNDCSFYNSYISNGELKNTKSVNSKFENTKSINSYFKNSVFKNSNYNSENIIKILAYDEFIASEHQINSTYSSINDVVQKVYKFYIDRNSYERLRTGDFFYIKGLKINDNTKNVLNFFDKKFKINSWTEYTEENYTITNLGKRGYEYSTFLSTPGDNSYKYTSVNYGDYSSNYYTSTYATSSNNYYSIDIWVKRYDIDNNLSSDKLDFNISSTSSSPYYNITDPLSLGNIIDITNAYIVDSDFDSGIFENSDWNSGYHINKNNDLNITYQNKSGGTYNLSINEDGNIIATTSYNVNYPEDNLLSYGDIVFLDSIDFNNGSSITRLPNAFKIISNNTNGVYELEEIGNINHIQSLTSSGYFYTNGASNRYGHLKNLKINKSNIKSGLFRRPYICESLIQNSNYDQFDKEYNNLDKIKSLVISDSIFSDKSNILSFGTYIYSFFLNGSDKWYSGIVQDSIWNGMTFSNGVIKESRWVNGIFENGYFYNSRSFNANSSATSPYFYSENKNSYYKDGLNLPNNRLSWQNGIFKSGEFQQSDWEGGTFSNGNFWYSKWYDGVFENGKLGDNRISVDDTIFYNGTVSYAIVENASFFSKDTSEYKNIPMNIVWLNGVFNGGIFGTYINNIINHSSIWHNGVFNGGNFISNARWKNGKFNGGKFISTYGYTQSTSNPLDYTWENGEFNGGEFGNGTSSANSMWYNGVFNNGVFKGRDWYNGIFIGGEFQGSGGNPVSGLTCSNASNFVDSFTNSYWGKWRNGMFTNIKDRFIKDEKIFTTLTKANINKPIAGNAKFKNALWESGTFSHPNGEMISSVWLDGAFERGKFIGSSFNPYVKRNGNTQSSFNLNDETCYWENGEFENSDFYISKWKNGKFIIGTATGMIWENGTSNYMNAFNVIWENGLWRNGNWYGSSFEFDGELNDDYTKQILVRGMSYSGTSSCHIWNIFQMSTNQELTVSSVLASTVSVYNINQGWVSSYKNNDFSIIENIS